MASRPYTYVLLVYYHILYVPCAHHGSMIVCMCTECGACVGNMKHEQGRATHHPALRVYYADPAAYIYI